MLRFASSWYQDMAGGRQDRAEIFLSPAVLPCLEIKDLKIKISFSLCSHDC